MSDQGGWIVLMVESGRESRAEQGLREAGWRTYFPHYRKQLKSWRVDDETGRKIRSRKGGTIAAPLFPGYGFVELWPDQQWSGIRERPAVIGIIMGGTKPKLVGGVVVEAIRDRVEAGEFDDNKPAREMRADLRDAMKAGDVFVRVPEFNDGLGRLVELHSKGSAIVWLQGILGREVRATVRAETLEMVRA